MKKYIPGNIPKLNYDSLTNSEISFTEIIEARLRARAGNPVVHSIQNRFINKKAENKSSLIPSKSDIEKLLKDFNK